MSCNHSDVESGFAVPFSGAAFVAEPVIPLPTTNGVVGAVGGSTGSSPALICRFVDAGELVSPQPALYDGGGSGPDCGAEYCWLNRGAGSEAARSQVLTLRTSVDLFRMQNPLGNLEGGIRPRCKRNER